MFYLSALLLIVYCFNKFQNVCCRTSAAAPDKMRREKVLNLSKTLNTRFKINREQMGRSVGYII